MIKKKDQKSNIEYNIDKNNSEILELNTKITILNEEIKKINDKIEEEKRLEKEYQAYSLYTEAISRDGIPYDIITQAVPIIENEINNILNQIVEFNIILDSDGKNISPYIEYDNKKWPLELSSGLEKFVSSLAIRVALINVSNLPRPTFLCIDEGFGVADSDNLLSMQSLFSYLKTNFEFVLVVSHIDALKDMVDTHLEIKRNGSFSNIKFV